LQENHILLPSLCCY